MPEFLKPDKTRTITVGGAALRINEKIIPDTMVAPRDVASYCMKGQPMKPRAKLSDGTGKPRGICIHNTGDIKVSTGTNAAEQYTRATFSGNMKGVVVHYYIWEREIWQNLHENERGWHAADGKTRRASKRGGGKTIGGNLDTIAIEAIGARSGTEDTTARLTAHLCHKYGLDPALDIYQHWDFSGKNCPIYIRPHWAKFIATVQGYLDQLQGKTAPAPKPAPATASTASSTSTSGDREYIVKPGDGWWGIAAREMGSGTKMAKLAEANGKTTKDLIRPGERLKIPAK